jgi:hypothetical protein
VFHFQNVCGAMTHSGTAFDSVLGSLSEKEVAKMGKLPKLTLSKNEKAEQWELRHDKTGRLVEAWDTKQEAAKGGVLEEALGEAGGSVKIEKEKGGYQEERTFPRSADPKKSPG